MKFVGEAMWAERSKANEGRMETMMQTWRIPAIAAAVAMFGCLSGPAVAQLDRARDTVNQTTNEGAASQRRIDAIDDETSELVRNYRSILRQVEDLQAYNQQRRELIEAQMAEMDSIREQIDRVKTIERDIVPLMQRMIEGLDMFVELDVPFRIAERRERVERLQSILSRSDVTIAEQFRLVLEAYQIENDYGRTIESYSAFLGEGDQRREVDFLMIGRAAFFYQTKNREETAVWNQARGEWVELPSRYNASVRTGMDMANEFIPPEILILPVFGPEEGGETLSAADIARQAEAAVLERTAAEEAAAAEADEAEAAEDDGDEAADDGASDSDDSTN